MSFITTQIGMFSYSGLSKDQMVRLRSEFGVYGIDTRPHLRGGAQQQEHRLRLPAIAKVLSHDGGAGNRAVTCVVPLENLRMSRLFVQVDARGRSLDYCTGPGCDTLCTATTQFGTSRCSIKRLRSPALA